MTCFSFRQRQLNPFTCKYKLADTDRSCDIQDPEQNPTNSQPAAPGSNPAASLNGQQLAADDSDLLAVGLGTGLGVGLGTGLRVGLGVGLGLSLSLNMQSKQLYPFLVRF